jgi:hypothetical protein
MSSDLTLLMAQMTEALQEIRAAAEGISALSGALKSLKTSAASLVEIGREIRQEQAEQTALLQALLHQVQNRPDLAAEEAMYNWEKLLTDFHSKPYAELTAKEKHGLLLRFQDFQRSHRKVKFRDVAGLEAKRRFETVIKDALDCYERLLRDEQGNEQSLKEVVAENPMRSEPTAEGSPSPQAAHREQPPEPRGAHPPVGNAAAHKEHHALEETIEGQGHLLDLIQKLKARFRDMPNVNVLLGMHSFTLRAHDPPRIEGITWRVIDEQLDVPHYEARLSVEQAEKLLGINNEV